MSFWDNLNQGLGNVNSVLQSAGGVTDSFGSIKDSIAKIRERDLQTDIVRADVAEAQAQARRADIENDLRKLTVERGDNQAWPWVIGASAVALIMLNA